MRTSTILLLLAWVSHAGAAPPELEIRILYDNTTVRQDVAPDWGFAALVSHRGTRVLFDAGTNADLFIQNANVLGIDWKTVSQVLISHQHADHTGGIPRLGRLNPSLVFHFLDRFPTAVYEEARKAGISPKRVSGPFEVAPGMYSTGTIEGSPPEQALVIETGQGLVVVTGCSHPGIVKIIETAERQRGKNSVRLVVGGFHMLKYSPEEIGATLSRLKELHVNAIVPTHCTGEQAIAKFREAYGAKFESGGAGKRIALE